MSGRGSKLPTLSWPLARITERPGGEIASGRAGAAPARSANPPTILAVIAEANEQARSDARVFMITFYAQCHRYLHF